MDLCILEIALRKRQQALWRKIVKEFEVEQSLNVQVQNWIREGTVSEKAYAKSRRSQKP
jgi:hypothetical protein